MEGDCDTIKMQESLYGIIKINIALLKTAKNTMRFNNIPQTNLYRRNQFILAKMFCI